MVKIRLMRLGATKRPFYRVVVADSRSPRDGRIIESIGKYHPLEDPSFIEVDEERALYWLSQGAQPTEQVEVLLKIQGIRERFDASRQASGGARARGKGGGSPAPSDTPEAPGTIDADKAPTSS